MLRAPTTQKVGGLDAEFRRQPVAQVDARGVDAALEFADIGLVDAGAVGQLGSPGRRLRLARPQGLNSRTTRSIGRRAQDRPADSNGASLRGFMAGMTSPSAKTTSPPVTPDGRNLVLRCRPWHERSRFGRGRARDRHPRTGCRWIVRLSSGSDL